MSWDYRILAIPYTGKTLEDSRECFFQIHEVHYNKKGKPKSYTENPVPVLAESMQGIKFILKAMKDATKKPILYHGDRFPEEYKK